jgi:hypothetical protein
VAWRSGQSIDIARWMEPVQGKTPATVVSVAHLDDEERALVLGVILEEVLTGCGATSRLSVFRGVWHLPPASPPTKRPLVR